MSNKKIQSFTDLVVWQEAHRLVIMIYKVTKKFVREELFGLTSQICRSAVSVSSNIAEGFERKTYKDKSSFYTNGRGSLLQNQLTISRDVGYLNKLKYGLLDDQTVTIHKLLNGLIRETNNRLK